MIATYLQEYETKNYTKVSDKELNEIFQEVRTKFPDRFYVQERDVVYKKWFKKITKTVYTVYSRINGCEFQELNFYGGSSSICTNVDSSVVYALFMGLLNSNKN